MIDAFNRDKPFDQFIREQLAGDEIDPGGAEALIATGYYRLGIWDDEPADRPLARYDGLDGIISTTGQVFLGMTVNCARCHDHKIDPIPQKDYYRLLSFFQNIGDPNAKNLRKVDRRAWLTLDVMCVTDGGRAETHVLLRGNPTWWATSRAGRARDLERRRPAFVNGPGKRRRWRSGSPPPQPANGPRDGQSDLAVSFWPRNRADAQRFWRPGRAGHPSRIARLAGRRAHGRRLAIEANPSAHRALERLPDVVAGIETRARRRPVQCWYWRFPMRRLTAEEVRDSILAVSGTLNLKAGGPSVYPADPKEVMAGQSVPGQGWFTSPPDEAARRSIYVHVKRSLLVPIMATHDAADTDFSCPVRYTTTVPTQALGLLNGDVRQRAGRPPSPAVYAARHPATWPKGPPRHPADDRPRARPRRSTRRCGIHQSTDRRRTELDARSRSGAVLPARPECQRIPLS